MAEETLNIFISAGEVSGDLHAAALVVALKKRMPNARFFGMGDAAMATAGVELLASIRDHSAIGMWQSARELTRVKRTIRELKEAIETQRPDFIIVVDCEAIHLPLLRAIQPLSIPNTYYISPQVWWTRNGYDQDRIAKNIQAVTDHVLAIFRAEHAVYTKLDHSSAHYIGHPLLDLVRIKQSKAAAYAMLGLPMDRPIIGVFPGSRWQEIKSTYPRLIRAAQTVVSRGVHAHIVVVVGAPRYARYIRDNTPDTVPVYSGDSYGIIPHLTASLVSSGTVTLEHALFRVPIVVAYRFGALLTLFIRVWLQFKSINLAWISLPNLMMQHSIVPECLQRQATVDNLAHALYQLCDPQYPTDQNPYRQRQYKGFQKIKEYMGPNGAVDRAAGLVSKWINNSSANSD
ncbi:lipid-A-disaccharide synthase [bacterium]|nr:lipid-A-disaccharide synthase [bacterium]|tara:strand:- start:1132 stop:2337 length:1206 start_codon:yes stop_codon:yes gene_type:complete